MILSQPFITIDNPLHFLLLRSLPTTLVYTAAWCASALLLAVILLDADRHWEASTLPDKAIAPSTLG
ncbi:hypothetical protein [Microcoleus sp. B13-B6]|uniref:hypothetical protein n=1 Tax=Microcoleus sp. B13-B6 TaxID=2818652 RepID=UPI002FD6C28E